MRNGFHVSACRRFPEAGSVADARAAIRFCLDHCDALAVVSAQPRRCESLLKENLEHGHQLDVGRIVNPFIFGPELLDTS